MDTSSAWQQNLTRAGVVVLVSLLVVFMYLMFLAGRFKGVTGVNAMDYAQIARNLASGKGYTTNLIRPLSLAKYGRFDRHPELATAPLHPYIMSLFMRMTPDKSRAVALACGLGFLLAVPAVFFLGWQLFDLRTGILSSALYVTNVEFLRYSISGLEVSWLSLWVTLLFLTCYALSRKARWRLVLSAVAGLLVALIYLTQYLWGVILPLVAVYVVLSSDRRTRWLTLGVFVLTFIIAITPWCIRNLNVTGHLFCSFTGAQATMATRSNPGNTLFRQYVTEYPSWMVYAISRPMEIIQKFLAGLGLLYLALIRVAGPYLTPFFLVAVLVTLGSATFERLRLLWWAMFVAVFVTLCMITVADWLLVPLGPVAAIISVGFFYRLLEARVQASNPKYRNRMLGAGVGILCAINVLPLGFELLGGTNADDDANQRLAAAAKEVASLTSGPIVTDAPWAIAWYADRPALWLPKTRADLRKIKDRMGQIPHMLLTPQVVNQRFDAMERTIKEWGYAYQEALTQNVEFEGYRATKRIQRANWVLWEADPRAKRDLPPEVLMKYGVTP